ncbi:PREDICTED: uncharacterized protein LOC108770802 isoform X1 [Trachymyrmex cornetzi]|uniref:Transcription factor Adf-1 n=2 Tax=Trachymyrmex cornetzi TaxID=471704 RepID=A0A151JSV4_9HYME|nr:PREDICTED: uncharacterized protein LOC108770802 isoform X1 [Trachymyrmex cornetzi]KYN30325.1 hypothetical protein ALC57_00247 [Trachymyrmex cornetzi]
MRDEVKMDANRLIAEVYKRPALWNQRHISYHNREVTNRVWMEIAAIFNLPKPMLKAKWKGLRDTFRAELKKDQVYRKSKFHRNRPVWIHFKSLQFLKEQMLPRPPIWERSIPKTEDELQPSEGEGENGMLTSSIDGGLDDRDTIADHLLSMAGDGNIGHHHHHHRHHHQHKLDGGDGRRGTVDVKREPEESFDNLEFQNVTDNLAENEMMLQNISPEQVLMSDSDTGLAGVDPLEGSCRFDDNYYFLMSLLPHIRTLPADRRMLLRMQMQELVYKEVYNKATDDESTAKT